MVAAAVLVTSVALNNITMAALSVIIGAGGAAANNNKMVQLIRLQPVVAVSGTMCAATSPRALAVMLAVVGLKVVAHVPMMVADEAITEAVVAPAPSVVAVLVPEAVVSVAEAVEVAVHHLVEEVAPAVVADSLTLVKNFVKGIATPYQCLCFSGLGTVFALLL